MQASELREERAKELNLPIPEPLSADWARKFFKSKDSPIQLGPSKTMEKAKIEAATPENVKSFLKSLETEITEKKIEKEFL